MGASKQQESRAAPKTRSALTVQAVQVAGAGLLAVLLVVALAPDIARSQEGTRLGGESLLGGLSATRAKVQRMLGAPPLRCISSTPERWLCTWRVEPDESAYELLASGRAFGSPIHLLCVFASPRHDATGQCTSHRAIPLRELRRTTENEDSDGPRKPASQDHLARQAIEAARSLESISQLLGAGPDECRERDDRDWVCYWQAGPNDPGFATLGRLAEDPESVARLICLLPLDGSDRGEDSCRINLAALPQPS